MAPMADETMTLAGDFAPVTHDDWLAAVDKVLKGRPFDKVLRTTLADGIVTEPLYTQTDQAAPAAVPGPGVSRRSSTPAPGAWDIRQRHTVRVPADANAAILNDLQRGVTSIELDCAAITTSAQLTETLNGVLFELAPVALAGPGDNVEPGRWLLQTIADAGVVDSAALAVLGCDPIGAAARVGGLDRSIDVAIADTAALASQAEVSHPNVRTITVSGVPYGEAGASAATEVGAVLATATAYLRALCNHGMTIEAALGQLQLTMTIGVDQFLDIAKLRALRVCWARVVDACGATPTAASVQAITSSSVLTTRDPWVNMLRTTLGCFAAAAGGADIVTVRPFDSIVGLSDELGLRIARNTQLVLMHESNLHRVVDPAGGSWYAEQLTDQVAHEAWKHFQTIEAEGGIVASLAAGAVQERIATAWAATERSVATRRAPITGVSEFPDLDEDALDRAPHPSPAAAPTSPVGPPLPVRRLAAGFERLRATAEAATARPSIFLANLGPVASHTARSSWAKNFFEAGGIAPIDNDGFDDDAALTAAFSSSGASIVVLCSSDDIYAERAVSGASALKAAGAQRVYLAGNPGDNHDAWRTGGVDEFVHVGCDVFASLESVHTMLGLTPAEASAQ